MTLEIIGLQDIPVNNNSGGNTPVESVTKEDLINIEKKIPTKTSQLENDSDYVTNDTITTTKTELQQDIQEVYDKVLITDDLDTPEEITESILVSGDVVQTMGTDEEKIMSQKAVSEILLPLQQMLLDEDFLQENYAYGIEFDTTISTPTCTRIGNMNYHKSLPIHSLIKGCLLDDNGNVVEYLPKDDWINSTRDGSKGQVMVEIPEHYRKFVTNDTKHQVWLSTIPLQGYHRVPKCYVSAYQATVQRSTLKLSSVVNTDPDYRGGNNKADWDNTYRTLCGFPATSISRTNFRTYARNRKTTTAEWNCMTYDMQKTLYWLFVTEYATLNTQATYNSTLTTEGFKQGGLGAGVTNIDYKLWTTYNSNNPIIPCGYTDSLGNNTGVVTFTMPEEYNTTLLNISVPRYRGIENPFGHIWQWTDGINIRISPTEENGGDGLSKVFICNDPSKFNDSNYTGYTYVGDEARTEGYVKELIFGEYGEIMPKATEGSSSTYFCDYHYTNIPSEETLRGVLFGGDAIDGAYAGFVFAASNNAPSYSIAYFGSRLCFYFQDNV